MKINFRQIFIGLFLWPLPLGLVNAQDQKIVDIEMVLAVDISSSVDAGEFQLQMDGLAEAFRNPEIIAAIEGLDNGGIALNLVHWSGTWAQSTVVAWTRVFDKESAERFAKQVQNAERAFPGGATSISGAIHYGLTELQSNNFDGNHLVIDIMGDGRGNDGPLPTSVRDRAMAMGVTINGVAIINEQPFVDSYYEENVIGGLDSFVLQAEDYEDFARAILEKLLREIKQRSPSGQNVV
ncbi:MAG: hypothetical protein CMM32_10475 [Rhodospirillaceae bacterium]|nr:hypothetical protein [Rhodospirillaceae bacterium]|tara:strand:- start:1271 stop:1984 length:714 start_codon:yes stop_codon:yes gene_type:complete